MTYVMNVCSINIVLLVLAGRAFTLNGVVCTVKVWKISAGYTILCCGTYSVDTCIRVDRGGVRRIGALRASLSYSPIPTFLQICLVRHVYRTNNQD